MNIAKNQWVKLAWNGATHSLPTPKDLPEPEWPEISFDEMVEIGFKDGVIYSPDHAVIKALIGDE